VPEANYRHRRGPAAERRWAAARGPRSRAEAAIAIIARAIIMVAISGGSRPRPIPSQNGSRRMTHGSGVAFRGSRGAFWVLTILQAFGVPASLRAVVINEIHYNPPEGSNFEFIEILNDGPVDAVLDGWTISGGADFTFPEGTVLEAGGYLVIARDRAGLASRYGIPSEKVLGNFRGSLDNGGERLALQDAEETIIEEVRYDDSAPWDGGADGLGASLQRICVSFPATHPANWRGREGVAPTPLAANVEIGCPPPALPAPRVAINEIYYHPLRDMDAREEFIELRNNTAEAINLKGYSFTDGVTFEFEADAELPAGGFAVVCRDVEAFRAIYDGPNLFGNFTGQLANDGERITLVDAGGVFVDSVRYRDSGDWPVAPDGLGYSLEKVVPTAVSDDPASWREAIHGDAAAWKTVKVKGVATSSRMLVYLEGEGDTIIDGFQLVNLASPETNFIPNGGFDAGIDPWTANGNHADTTWVETGGPDGSGALRMVSTGAGSGATNGLSLEIAPELDRNPTLSYQLTFQYRTVTGTPQLTARLSGSTPSRGIYFRFGQGAARSPGRENAVLGSHLPPFIDRISRSPREPASQDTVWVTARVRGDRPIARTTLSYTVNFRDEAVLEMLDDGQHQDGRAGDGFYGAAVPPQAHNAIVLFTIRAEDDAGAAGVSPVEKDPTGAHGFYVNDLQPESKLPVYHLLVTHTSPNPVRSILGALQCGAYRDGSFAYRGDLYYNVGVRRRGQSVCSSTKPFLKVRFNRGREFRGRKKINLQSLWTDKALIRETLAWEAFGDVGMPTCSEFHVRLHANGRYYGLYAELEHPDQRFLERNNLNGDGNLYKAYASTEQQMPSYQAGYEKKTNENGDFTDLADFLNTMHRTPRADLVTFFSERTDEDRIIDYQLAQTLTNNSDYPHKNHYLYHNPDNDRWMSLTWDMDLTYGKIWDGNNSGVYHDRMHNPGNLPFYTTSVDSGLGNHLLDKFFSQAGTWYRRAYLVRLWNALQEKYTEAFHDERIAYFRELLMEEQAEDIAAWGRTPPSADDSRAPPQFEPNLERVREHVRLRRAFLINHVKTRYRTIPELPRMKITELMFNPSDRDEKLEFIELWNCSGRDIDVTGWSIEGIGFSFPDGATVADNEVVVVAKDLDAMRLAHGKGLRLFGPYEGNLDNNGEIIRLKDGGPEYPATVDFLRYGVGGGWPQEADGHGRSLELTAVAPDRDNDLPHYWRASLDSNGSPGKIEGITSALVSFRRGDVDADGRVNIGDAVAILFYLFRGFQAPGCVASADVNADGNLQLADAVYLLSAIFGRGAAIPPPGPSECLPLADAERCAVSNCEQ
jgi:hypothetical protein